MTDPTSSRSFKSERYFTAVLVCIAASTISLQALALGPLKHTFWGYHLYAFMPLVFAISSWGVIAAGMIFALKRRAATAEPPEPEGNGVTRWVLPIVFAALAAGLFWLLRSNQLLLGDAGPLTDDLPTGKAFHPRQPFTMWFQQVLYRSLGGVFGAEGAAERFVARDVVAVGSVAAGAAFTVAAWFLGRSLAGSTSHGNRTGFLAALVIGAQGYAVLFFGYVENYAYFAFLVAAYLLAGALYLRRGVPLQLVAVIFLVGVGCHLSMIGLLPSLIVLFAIGLSDDTRRRDAVLGLVVLAVGAVLVDRVFSIMSPGYRLWTAVRDLLAIANDHRGGGSTLAYVFSWRHARDFLNAQFLIGPLAAFLFVPGVVFDWLNGGLRRGMDVFLSAAGLGFLLGSWFMSEPHLGYARDWDIFAPAGICYTVGGVYFLLRFIADSRRAKALCAFGLAVSIAHLAPWVWINHSEAVSLERVKTLPLGLGRTEVVVGNWHFKNGETDKAIEWFNRALEEYPYNVAAYNFLGHLYAERNQLDASAEMYLRAVTLRPDKPDFHWRYALVLVELGRHAEAVPHLQWLVERQPNRVAYWQVLAQALAEAGNSEEMQAVREETLAALDRVLAADPENADAIILSGYLLMETGRPEKALMRYQRALELDPNSEAALFNTGALLLKLGEPERARRFLEWFLVLYPDHPNAAWVRGQLEK